MGGIEHERHHYLYPSCFAEASSSTVMFPVRCRRGRFVNGRLSGGMASDKGSDSDASNEYVNLDRRHSSSAMGRGSTPTEAHHEASSP
jgi:hypothetical protein